MSKTFDEVMADVDKLMKIDDDRKALIAEKREQVDSLEIEILEIQDNIDANDLAVSSVKGLLAEVEAIKEIMRHSLIEDNVINVFKDLKSTSVISETAYRALFDRLNLEESPDIEQGLDEPHDNIEVGAGYRETG